MSTNIRTEEELNVLRENAKVHKIIFQEIKKIAQPWVSAKIIDDLVENICKKFNVLPAFKGLYDFPASICISVNDVVAHGIPNESVIFQKWDVVKFDFWVKDKKIGLNTDAAFTMIIGDEKNPNVENFLRVNQEALMKWVAKCVVWNRIWDVSHAIQSHIEANWFHVIKQLSGHAIGYEVHEEPYIYNFGKPGTWEMLKKNMTFCIEPLIWFTTWEIYQDEEWNIYMADWCLWSQFEHMVVVKEVYPEILV